MEHEYYEKGVYTFFNKNVGTKTRLMGELLDDISSIHTLSGAKLLDVGCGEGALLDLAKSHGANVKGIEPSPQVVSKLKNRGLDGFAGLLEDYEPEAGESWDIITMFLVLDAMMDPVAELKRIRSLIADDGVLAILTGSRFLTPFFTPPRQGYGGMVPRIVRPRLKKFMPYGKEWENHPYYFTRNSLLAMLAVAGFQVDASKNLAIFGLI